jgi:L-ascorbate metabolism protein UlaG (beta-lactamase superfamily)
MVTVSWFGHCCFEVKGENCTVLTDPHDGVSLGLSVPDSKPDVALISHPHDDHASGRKYYDYILDSPGSTVVNGSEIQGVRAYHDDVEGERLGVNVFFRFEVDGLRFGHTGDLEHILDSRQLHEIGQVDILFSGIGEKAQANIDLLKPRVVIPMHYHIEGIIFPWFRMPDVDDYVRDRPHRKLEASTHTYTEENLPDSLEYYVYKLR